LLAVPCAAALLAYLIRRLRNELTFAGAVVSLYYAVRVFVQSRHGTVRLPLLDAGSFRVVLQADAFSGFLLLFVGIFGVLVLAYSLRYMRGAVGTRGYYLYMPLLIATANGVLLAGTLPVLLFFWGGMLAVLYGLLLVGEAGREKVAAKTLILVGLSDFALLLGIALLLAGGGVTDVAPAVPMGLTEPRFIASFALIALGALAKAGSMPLHTWIPDAARTAPAPVMAFVPGALDKLLGIYLLVRLSVYMFSVSSNTGLRIVLMAIGAVTILSAVLMALIQKRVSRLLAFHAVSQVGYMVLGIGTGVPVGIAGGLFHMLNHSIYKSALFLSAGSVSHNARTDEIDQLGGLAGRMPVTFVSFLVAALAIAGVPPLNGLVS
jgi:formate hydrogenlyase subunit 3/multisubunit Na+/H+ antiporter MnhD subunit